MRFKKLRISVGIALVIFIFIIGNIIVFGKLVDKNSNVQVNNLDQNTVLVDPKKIVPQEPLIETKTEPPVEVTQKTVDTTPTEQPKPKIVESAPNPEPVVVHTSRRTHAS